jgi:hypothetical protein
MPEAGVGVVHLPFGPRVDTQNHDSQGMRDGPAIPTLGQSYLDSDRSVNRPRFAYLARGVGQPVSTGARSRATA